MTTAAPVTSTRRGQHRLADVARGSTLNLVGAGVAAVTSLAVTVVITRHFRSRWRARSSLRSRCS